MLAEHRLKERQQPRDGGTGCGDREAQRYARGFLALDIVFLYEKSCAAASTPEDGRSVDAVAFALHCYNGTMVLHSLSYVVYPSTLLL
ncbi:hypothetical protein ACN47E_003077 [Coniothyrium glycines]